MRAQPVVFRDRLHCNGGATVTTVDYEACLKAFRGPAEEFFRIVENAPETAPVEFLRQVQLILPQLHLAALHLPDVDSDDWGETPRLPRIPDEQHMAVHNHLKALLGSYDLYWHVFDSRDHKEGAIYGSLTDDLEDIYFDLKNEIQALDHGASVAYVLWGFRCLFYGHWGAHLVDASKAIHDHLAAIEEE